MSVPIKAPQTIQLPDVPPAVKVFASFTLRPESQLTASSKPTVRIIPIMCTVVSIVCPVSKTVAKVRFFYDMMEKEIRQIV